MFLASQLQSQPPFPKQLLWSSLTEKVRAERVYHQKSMSHLPAEEATVGTQHSALSFVLTWLVQVLHS